MDYKRLKNLSSIVTIVGFVILAFAWPNDISYAGGFLLGSVAGYIAFYWIVQTVNKAPLLDVVATKRRLHVNHLGRVIFYAGVLLLALYMPGYFHIMTTFIGLFVVKLSLAISQVKVHKGS